MSIIFSAHYSYIKLHIKKFEMNKLTHIDSKGPKQQITDVTIRLGWRIL